MTQNALDHTIMTHTTVDLITATIRTAATALKHAATVPTAAMKMNHAATDPTAAMKLNHAATVPTAAMKMNHAATISTAAMKMNHAAAIRTVAMKMNHAQTPKTLKSVKKPKKPKRHANPSRITGLTGRLMSTTARELGSTLLMRRRTFLSRLTLDGTMLVQIPILVHMTGRTPATLAQAGGTPRVNTMIKTPGSLISTPSTPGQPHPQTLALKTGKITEMTTITQL